MLMNTPDPTPVPPILSRRHALGAALAAGAGVALAQNTMKPEGATPGPATRPSIGPDGQPLAPEYVDRLPPGMRGDGQLVKGYASPLAKQPLRAITIKRREPNADDVELDITFAGICHSDIHFVNDDWKNTIYPCMPGHEFVGKVTRVGSSVTKFKAGDTVAVGPVIDSCGQCPQCQAKMEQYCEGPKGRTEAYNGPSKPDGTNTYGGYSKRYVVKDKFCYAVPSNLDPKGVAPLLCAGMTVWSPLVHWKAGPGMKVGVAGMGGLGHMAVKLAAALGAEVTVFSTTPEKEADAMKFGAKKFVLTTDFAAMKTMELTQDLILNTIPYPYDPNTYIKPLARDGQMIAVGLLFPFAVPPDNMLLTMHRRHITSSLVGGPADYAPFLKFCGEKNIVATTEVVPLEGVNEAYPKVQSKLVRYRYVIDMTNSLRGA